MQAIVAFSVMVQGPDTVATKMLGLAEGEAPIFVGFGSMVIADPVANSVIVTCREDEFSLVADLIASSAREPDAPEVVVKVFPLAETNVTRAASGLNAALARPRGNRFKELSITIDADGKRTSATFDPVLVSVPDAVLLAVLDIDDVALELIDEVALLVWVLLGVVSLHSPRPSRR